MRAFSQIARTPAAAPQAATPAPVKPAIHVVPRVQRLAISHPADSSEREADQIADTIMRMPSPGESLLQRKCSCSEEETLQRKALTSVESGLIQRVVGTPEQCRRDSEVGSEEDEQECDGSNCRKKRARTGSATSSSQLASSVLDTTSSRVSLFSQLPSPSSGSSYTAASSSDRPLSMAETLVASARSSSASSSFASLSFSTGSGSSFSTRSTTRTPAKKRGRDSDEEQEALLQMKSIDGSAHQVNGSVAARVSSLPGGAPLPASERAFFEPRFGVNLESVRLHTGGPASELARSVHARAFTVRDQIVFGSGEYRPSMSEGRRLLAHELTHTMQQGAVGDSGGTIEPMIQRLCHATNRKSGSPEQIQIQQYLGRNATVENEYYVRNPAGNCYYPDVVDTQSLSVWEIKPWTDAAAAAAAIANYVPAAQTECLGGGGWHAGTAGELNALFAAVLPAEFITAGGAGPWQLPGIDPNEFIEVDCPVAGTIVFRSVPLEGLPGDVLGQIGIGGGTGALGSGSNRRRRAVAQLPPADVARVIRLFSPTAGGANSVRARMAAINIATLRGGVSAAGVLIGAGTPFAAAADVQNALPAAVGGGAPPNAAAALGGAVAGATAEQKAAIVADALWGGGVGLAALVAAAGLGVPAQRQLYADVLLTLPRRNLATAITAMIAGGGFAALGLGAGLPAAGAAAGAPAAGTLGGALPTISPDDASSRMPTNLLRNQAVADRATVVATANAGAAPPSATVTGGLAAAAVQFLNYVRSGPEIGRLADLVISDIGGAALPAYGGAALGGAFGAVAAAAGGAIGGAAGGAAAVAARNRIIDMWQFALHT